MSGRRGAKWGWGVRRRGGARRGRRRLDPHGRPQVRPAPRRGPADGGRERPALRGERGARARGARAPRRPRRARAGRPRGAPLRAPGRARLLARRRRRRRRDAAPSRCPSALRSAPSPTSTAGSRCSGRARSSSGSTPRSSRRRASPRPIARRRAGASSCAACPPAVAVATGALVVLGVFDGSPSGWPQAAAPPRSSARSPGPPRAGRARAGAGEPATWREQLEIGSLFVVAAYAIAAQRGAGEASLRSSRSSTS